MLFLERSLLLGKQARVHDDLCKSSRSAFCCWASGDREIFARAGPIAWLLKQLMQPTDSPIPMEGKVNFYHTHENILVIGFTYYSKRSSLSGRRKLSSTKGRLIVSRFNSWRPVGSFGQLRQSQSDLSTGGRM